VTDRDGEVTVRFKLDAGTVTKRSWNAAEGYHGIFAPEPILFLHQLAHSSTFVFEYSPWQKVPKEVVFQVAPLPASVITAVDSAFAARETAAHLRDSLQASRALKRKQEYSDSLRAHLKKYGLDPCYAFSKAEQEAVEAKCPSAQ
jgi:hypothetical protein